MAWAFKNQRAVAGSCAHLVTTILGSAKMPSEHQQTAYWQSNEETTASSHSP
eukprot:CAMPEP_0195015110 /NCGR_PEP_ID=MMETSP0326_2-20130528/17891_1 /TAXON_ID=2866 ORGANISM="Crypthecodinium cohnii, Strain Seligo" /NCGR_SAMPLE_ID=MMETSP0326_2 /ASSEMBLY_ACC=CAM_ASM_000348 /LENGTH=51 /DNA_ID=CAMNT_0040028921 /DNA_START=443 /DNA_END=594 /DNA_ORIENTATION=-